MFSYNLACPPLLSPNSYVSGISTKKAPLFPLFFFFFNHSAGFVGICVIVSFFVFPLPASRTIYLFTVVTGFISGFPHFSKPMLLPFQFGQSTAQGNI